MSFQGEVNETIVFIIYFLKLEGIFLQFLYTVISIITIC